MPNIMDKLIGATSSWASKVRSQWRLVVLNRYPEKKNNHGKVDVEVIARSPDMAAADPLDSNENLPVAVSQHPYPYPPIYQLPTELLLYIFHHDDHGVKRRLILTHVCRQWRTIALASGSLWTNIKINPPPNQGGGEFERLIALLDLQLERSQSFPLDVFWNIRSVFGRIDGIINLLRLKGHFTRWRSLTLSITTNVHQPRIFPSDSFPKLESLTVLSVKPHEILAAINLTTTSKLRTLDILWSGTRCEDMEALYGAMLNRVTRLVLPNLTGYNIVNTLPPISARVTDLEASLRREHPFPHVKTYKLTTGIFRAGDTFDLRSLTTFVVTSSIHVENGCRLVLPSLHRFVCGHITLSEEAVLDAPRLAELEFRISSNFIAPGPMRTRFNYIMDILEHPGFLLSPKESLMLEPSLPADHILTMLTRYQHLENLELELNDDVTVWSVTVALGGRIAESGALCPRLTQLRLRIAPEYRDRHRIDWWKDRADQILQGRKNCAAALRISYGAWYQGETFVLLA